MDIKSVIEAGTDSGFSKYKLDILYSLYSLARNRLYYIDVLLIINRTKN